MSVCGREFPPCPSNGSCENRDGPLNCHSNYRVGEPLLYVKSKTSKGLHRGHSISASIFLRSSFEMSGRAKLVQPINLNPQPTPAAARLAGQLAENASHLETPPPPTQATLKRARAAPPPPPEDVVLIATPPRPTVVESAKKLKMKANTTVYPRPSPPLSPVPCFYQASFQASPSRVGGF